MASPKAPRISKVAPTSYFPADLTEVRSEDRLEALAFTGDDGAGLNLAEVTFTQCRLEKVSLHEARLEGATFAESVLEDINAPVLEAPRSSWWNTSLSSSRIGSGELRDAAWRSVTVTGGKLGFLNFRYAKLTDVVFTGCLIEELDFSHAGLTRVAFRDCRIGTFRASAGKYKDLDLRGSELERVVDLGALRGSTIDEFQLQLMAPAMSAELGISVL